MKTTGFLLALAAAAIACAPAERESEDGPKYFEGEGSYLFHEVSDSRNLVTIDHGDIPDFMPAMSMPFPFSDLTLVEGLEPGQTIRFRVVQEEDGDFFVDRIEPLE